MKMHRPCPQCDSDEWTWTSIGLRENALVETWECNSCKYELELTVRSW